MPQPDALQFIGIIGTQNGSESLRSSGDPGVIDKSYVSAIARAHEFAGFDRALIGYFSSAPDGFQIAAYAAHQTQRLNLLLAHRPGFVAPTLAARQLASLDQLSDGRLAVHIITGGSDEEQARDGDFLGKDERYERTDEYLDILKKTWTSTGPFDHEGKHYKIKGSYAAVRPPQKPHIPIYFGGSSDAAIRVAGKHADVYALWGESLAQVKETVAAVRAAAAEHGREHHIRFSLSLRPVLGQTEDEAWARAAGILERAEALRAQSPAAPVARQAGLLSQAVGAQRLLQTASQGRVVDKRLWTEIATLNGGSGNSTGLVGTPEQVAEALLEYWDVGVSTFLIRGFDPLSDAIAYGRDLIPLVRSEIAQRSRLAAE
ncbi:LLM class flavin-dependent oxidoreductase [Phenylobacterium sp. LjRoot225]|uniref:LLM class flavin-dependent oxidoreductase n=1 Tax=Phenylobacterium sp. LjRoot225 TaxID=3342285 RepID=UPI003ECFCE3A